MPHPLQLPCPQWLAEAGGLIEHVVPPLLPWLLTVPGLVRAIALGPQYSVWYVLPRQRLPAVVPTALGVPAWVLAHLSFVPLRQLRDPPLAHTCPPELPPSASSEQASDPHPLIKRPFAGLM